MTLISNLLGSPQPNTDGFLNVTSKETTLLVKSLFDICKLFTAPAYLNIFISEN